MSIIDYIFLIRTHEQCLKQRLKAESNGRRQRQKAKREGKGRRQKQKSRPEGKV